MLRGMEESRGSALAAMDTLESVARDKEAATAAAKDTNLPSRAFALYWTLKDDPVLDAAGIDPMKVAYEAQVLMGRYPNAAANSDEERRLRASLYGPLRGVDGDEVKRIVDHAMTILVESGNDSGN